MCLLHFLFSFFFFFNKLASQLCWIISHHVNGDLSQELSEAKFFFPSLKRMKDYCKILAIVKRELRQSASLV